MSRPEPARIELVDDVEIVIGIEFIGRQDAVCIAGFEERDWDHQGAGELESLILGKDEVVRHPEGLHRERANSRSMAPSVCGGGRDHREGAAERPQLASGPLAG